MCGICGQYNFGDARPVDRRKHRGDDQDASSTGVRTTRGTTSPDRSDSVFAGFRSSILGGGHQPMSDPEESVWVIFNGEIYNFPELRRELEGHGHVFRTNSDTEVIVHGYKQWGDEVLNRLNGMFGLAIWDARKEAAGSCPGSIRHQADLLPARWGPFVLRLGDSAVRAAMPDRAEIDPDRAESIPALSLYALAVHDPQGRAEARSGDQADSPKRHCSGEPLVPVQAHAVCAGEVAGRSPGRVAGRFTKQAIRRQLISDVPVGLLLSGGIDSGLLLALMNLHGNVVADLHRRIRFELRGRRTGGCRRDRAHSGIASIRRVTITQSDLRGDAPEDCRLPGGAHRLFLDRSDVFRL